MQGIEGLTVFRMAYDLSLELHRASLTWPKVEQYGGIADQIRRSSKAVCALLIEGAGRRPSSAVEFERYVVMALGSVDEARLWCRYAEDLGYAEPEVAARWRSSCQEVARLLQGVLAQSKSRRKNSSER